MYLTYAYACVVKNT